MYVHAANDPTRNGNTRLAAHFYSAPAFACLRKSCSAFNLRSISAISLFALKLSLPLAGPGIGGCPPPIADIFRVSASFSPAAAPGAAGAAIIPGLPADGAGGFSVFLPRTVVVFFFFTFLFACPPLLPPRPLLRPLPDRLESADEGRDSLLEYPFEKGEGWRFERRVPFLTPAPAFFLFVPLEAAFLLVVLRADDR